MKKSEDPKYHICPRAMKYDEDIKEEIEGLMTPEIRALDIQTKVHYLMRATRGRYSPEKILEMLS